MFTSASFPTSCATSWHDAKCFHRLSTLEIIWSCSGGSAIASRIIWSHCNDEYIMCILSRELLTLLLQLWPWHSCRLPNLYLLSIFNCKQVDAMILAFDAEVDGAWFITLPLTLSIMEVSSAIIWGSSVSHESVANPHSVLEIWKWLWILMVSLLDILLLPDLHQILLFSLIPVSQCT